MPAIGQRRHDKFQIILLDSSAENDGTNPEGGIDPPRFTHLVRPCHRSSAFGIRASRRRFLYAFPVSSIQTPTIVPVGWA